MEPIALGEPHSALMTLCFEKWVGPQEQVLQHATSTYEDWHAFSNVPC